VDLPSATGWQEVKHPPSLFRRYDFTSYGETRSFLDRLAELSEETGLYPDLGFGTKHVNVTIHCSEADDKPAVVEFAARAATLA
jgi:pterin-4a-carbinolamine dehydratase